MNQDVGLRPVTPLGILAARLDAVCARADLAPDIAAELAAVRDLAVGFEPYLEEHTSPESSALAELAERTRTAPWAGTLEAEMLSGHVEGRFLAFLVGMTRARRVLEIGMFTGYSALAMAEALPQDGVVVALERDPRVAALARQWLDESDAGATVQVEVGPARETLRRLADDGAVFDLVFVDADKGGYLQYVDTVLRSSLLAPGGLIAVDNTLMQGLPWRGGAHTENGEAIAAFNEAMAADPRVEQVLLPLRDGLTLIRRV